MFRSRRTHTTVSLTPTLPRRERKVWGTLDVTFMVRLGPPPHPMAALDAATGLDSRGSDPYFVHCNIFPGLRAYPCP